MKLVNLIEEYGYEIYCDMDGVLCDFDRQFQSMFSVHPDKYRAQWGKLKFWDDIQKKGVYYWSEMPWMPDGKKLWDYIKRLNAKVLSAPADFDECKIGKKKWVKRYLGNPTTILTKQKEKYANSRSILIDDRPKYLNRWINAGGIGILHENTNKTLKELNRILHG